MVSRLLDIKYLVWAAALTFALCIAFLVFTIAGFGGGLGPSTWSDTMTNALAAVAIGIGSQVGLGLAPVARMRGVVPRGAITVLMTPALVLGALAYRDVFSRAEGLGARAIDHPLLLVYLLIAPVYLAVAVWMWRARRPGPVTAGDR